MSQTAVIENNVAVGRVKVSSAYVPPLQRTAGQPPPIAANGGLSYMSFERNGDGGTAKALEDALALIAEGDAPAEPPLVSEPESPPPQPAASSITTAQPLTNAALVVVAVNIWPFRDLMEFYRAS